MDLQTEIDDVMSTKSEDKYSIRKSKKPLMEKRRRQRINNCLQQLKSLVLQAMKKDTSHYSKLEKADILEMTVKHLRMLQRRQISTAVAADPTVATKYNVGFSECASEVIRYMSTVQGVNQDVKSRIMAHLDGCLQTMTSQVPMMAPVQPLHVQIPSSQTEALHHMYNSERLLAQSAAGRQLASHSQHVPSYDLLPGSAYSGHMMYLRNPDFQTPHPFATKSTPNGTGDLLKAPFSDNLSVKGCKTDSGLDFTAGPSRCQTSVGGQSSRNSSSPTFSPALYALKEERVWRPW